MVTRPKPFLRTKWVKFVSLAFGSFARPSIGHPAVEASLQLETEELPLEASRGEAHIARLAASLLLEAMASNMVLTGERWR